MKLINSKETEFEEPIEEMGQIALDTHTLSNHTKYEYPLFILFFFRYIYIQTSIHYALKKGVDHA